MDCTGKLVEVSKNWENNKFRLTYEVNEDVTGEVNSIKECEKLNISAKKHREKRSTDANGYYWKLLSQIAERLGNSKAYQHNWMLRRYGQLERFGEKVAYTMLPDTEEVERQVDESETYHLKPTSQVREGKDGVMYRTYAILKGSRGYDTREMSVLIDGVVTRAKELDIPTETPAEIERMKASWRSS